MKIGLLALLALQAFAQYPAPTGGGGGGGGATAGVPCILASKLGIGVDGTTDQTATLNALWRVANFPSGLCISIDVGGIIRADGQLIPWGGDITVTDSILGPVPPLRITSACAPQTASAEDHSYPSDCARLDLRFHASGLSRYNQGPKLFLEGRGTVELDHITIGDWGTDNAAYILTTGGNVIIHECTFYGSLTFTSTTSKTIATGAGQTFTVQSGVTLTGTPPVVLQSHANQNNWMAGTVTSYASTTLTVNVLQKGGSGTFADWDIRVGGASTTDQGIVLGGSPGTSCCVGDTTDYYQGYDSVIRHNMFNNFQRVLLLQTAVNALLFDGNHIRGGNTASPGNMIEMAGANGANAGVISGNVFSNNLFEFSVVSPSGKDYATAIALQGGVSNIIYGNSSYDGNGTTCMVGTNGTAVTANIIKLNYVSSGNLLCAPMDPTNHTDLFGVTASIGGGSVAAGACTSGTLTLTGVAAGMAVSATPLTYPGDGITWHAYVSANNTVTVKVCNFSAGALTPTSSTYTVTMQ